jgi:hypothetical protein
MGSSLIKKNSSGEGEGHNGLARLIAEFDCTKKALSMIDPSWFFCEIEIKEKPQVLRLRLAPKTRQTPLRMTVQ